MGVQDARRAPRSPWTSGFQGWANSLFVRLKRAQRHALDVAWLSWSIAMTDPKRDADKRRAEAERARRLAASLSPTCDQDRLKQYANELEGKAQQSKTYPARSRSIRKSERDRRVTLVHAGLGQHRRPDQALAPECRHVTSDR